jgi:hypothetical protein
MLPITTEPPLSGHTKSGSSLLSIAKSTNPANTLQSYYNNTKFEEEISCHPLTSLMAVAIQDFINW